MRNLVVNSSYDFDSTLTLALVRHVGNMMIYVMFMKIDSHEHSPSIGDFNESISMWIVDCGLCWFR